AEEKRAKGKTPDWRDTQGGTPVENVHCKPPEKIVKHPASPEFSTSRGYYSGEGIANCYGLFTGSKGLGDLTAISFVSWAGTQRLAPRRASAAQARSLACAALNLAGLQGHPAADIGG
uniref:hypothetical protein n=1 Tax=Pseudomonas sp. TaxID=306 RepID=UPI003564C0DA